MIISIILPALLLVGLILMVTGLVVLLKSSNKLAGWVVIAVGSVFTFFSITMILMVTITTSVRG